MTGPLAGLLWIATAMAGHLGIHLALPWQRTGLSSGLGVGIYLITGADVTVIVKEIHSKKIYLIGAVKREGPMPYTYRMNVMQALSEAGGLTDYAKRKKIYVLRTEKGKDYRFSIDYDAVLKGEHMEMNIPLLAGDTVVVPH